MTEDASQPLPVQGDTTAPVPAFTCLVYVKKVDGGVQARVGNLEMPACVAATQRDVLRKISAAFKQRVSELSAVDEPIKWIDPPSPLDDEERKFIVPVHL